MEIAYLLLATLILASGSLLCLMLFSTHRVDMNSLNMDDDYNREGRYIGVDTPLDDIMLKDIIKTLNSRTLKHNQLGEITIKDGVVYNSVGTKIKVEWFELWKHYVQQYYVERQKKKNLNN
jgi:hypothetical protein